MYTLRARTYPALLVVLPVGVVLFAWVPDGSFLEGGVISLLATGVGTALLAQWGRDAGKRKELELWKSWGGPPTTRLLRFRDTKNPVLLRVLRTKLEAITQVKLPSQEEETADPSGADELYEAAVSHLRELTRDRSKFPLVFEENVNYGFRRNLWGRRPVGLSVALLAAAGTWAILVYSASCPPGEAWVKQVIESPDVADVTRVVGAVANTIAIAIWVWIVTPGWVRIAAEAYAERLLSAVHILGEEQP